MTLSQALAPRSNTTLDTVQEMLGTLVARYRTDEILTSVRQIPAREAVFRPMPDWVRNELSEAYRAKGIKELYSHQAATAELVHNGRNGASEIQSILPSIEASSHTYFQGFGRPLAAV